MTTKPCCDHAKRLAAVEKRVDALYRNLSRLDEGIEEKTGSGIGITSISPAPNVLAFAPRKGRSA